MIITKVIELLVSNNMTVGNWPHPTYDGAIVLFTQHRQA